MADNSQSSPLSFFIRGMSVRTIIVPTSQFHVDLDDTLALLLLLLLSTAYISRGILWDKPDPLHHLWFEKPQEVTGDSQRQRETRDISKKLTESKDVVVFWGSQSGTSERLAVRLARECRRRFGLQAIVADLADYDAASIALIPSTKIAIFILSTYGEGDPPDNVNDLWSWLSTNTDVNLSNLRYAAFGLGNSHYKSYNRVIDVVTKGFDAWGAQALLRVGKADDAKGTTAEDFITWQEELFRVFRDTLSYKEQYLGYEPALSVVYDESMDIIDLHHGVPLHQREAKGSAMQSSKIYALPLKVARELFSTPNRNCVHLELDLSQYPELKYKTGDHVAIWPHNPTEEVERLLKVLGIQAQRHLPISISRLDPETQLKVPTPTTLDALLGHYIDICGPVSRDLLLSLAQFAPSASAKTVLTRLGSDPAAFTQYVSCKYMNIGRLLESLAEHGQLWKTLPISFIIEYLPPMKPRYYSISSSSVVQPQRVAITAVVSITTVGDDSKQQIPGLATNYMLRLKDHLGAAQRADLDTPSPTGAEHPRIILPPHHVHAHIRKSKFKLPLSSTVPIIMVASGTGIAPFRAFLEERVRIASLGRPVGKHMLFFRCRTAHGEFLYQEELQQLKAALGSDLEIVTAFSREEFKLDGSKIYVQDRVEERFNEVSKLLVDENACIYICGSAIMGRGVSRVLGECFKRKRGWDEQQFKDWSVQLKRQRKWHEDVWG